MTQHIICNTSSKFLFILLNLVCTLSQCATVRVGRWVDCDVDAATLAAFDSTAQELEPRVRDRNAVIANDTISHAVVVIASGMFPFSTMPNPQITELIDHIMPESAERAKNLNAVLSSLSQIQAQLGDTDKIKAWAQSVLTIIDCVPDVLEGTGIIITAGSDFMRKLDAMKTDGKRTGLATYLARIKIKLLEYYKAYVSRLKGYFSFLQDRGIAAEENQAYAQEAIRKLEEVEATMKTANAATFHNVVAQLQSVARFQDNAHKLVHSEDILLYLIKNGRISLCASGVRFFTMYDMCEICEKIIWNFAQEGSTPFVVLSRRAYLDSADRNNPGEKILLKKRI